MEMFTKTADWMQQIYLHDKANWDVALGALILIGIFSAIYHGLQPTLQVRDTSVGWLDFAPRRRGKNMRKARRDFIRSDTIDALVDHIEKRVAQGDYTRKEAKELYREARKAWHVKDLFPSPELLKENIKKRLASKQNDPVSLPGKFIRKNAFDKPAKT